MSQRPIDLLPESIRVRSDAHIRTGRSIAAAVSVVLVLTVLTTWSRISLERARIRLDDAERSAAAVLALETQAAGLQSVLDESQEYLERYRRIAPPLEISALLATVVNDLPSSVTLDQITIDAGRRRSVGSPRGTGARADAPIPPRILTAEIAGFAVSDSDVAELVERLTALPPLERVNLDYSRTRMVRDHAAREFRLSFRVDLDASYDVTKSGGTRSEEVAHVQP